MPKKGSNNSIFSTEIPCSSKNEDNKDVEDLSIDYYLPSDLVELAHKFNQYAAISRHNEIIKNSEIRESENGKNNFSSFLLVNCGILNKREFTEQNLHYFPNIGCFTNVDVNTIVISNGKEVKFVKISNEEIKGKIFKGIQCNLITINGIKFPDISRVRPGDIETIELRLKGYVANYIANEKKASSIVASSVKDDNKKKKSIIYDNIDDFYNQRDESSNPDKYFIENQISKVFDNTQKESEKHSLNSFLDSIKDY